MREGPCFLEFTRGVRVFVKIYEEVRVFVKVRGPCFRKGPGSVFSQGPGSGPGPGYTVRPSVSSIKLLFSKILLMLGI